MARWRWRRRLILGSPAELPDRVVHVLYRYLCCMEYGRKTVCYSTMLYPLGSGHSRPLRRLSMWTACGDVEMSYIWMSVMSEGIGGVLNHSKGFSSG
jgi:hypothetical protein